MSANAFLDTNVLVYAIETDDVDADKSSAAREILRSAEVCISTQVLGEFYAAVTSRRRSSPLAHDEATAWVQFWKGLETHAITIEHVDLALELAGAHGVAYYDALILAAARLARCTEVLSEDLNAGQDYSGVLVRNPFVRGLG
jgi:predicted nucleic acid-binding protein